jgi:multiple sugar transport system substrate-binding protein
MLVAGLGAGCREKTARKDEQGRTILRYLMWGRETELRNMLTGIEQFERANPDLRVVLQSMSSRMYQAKLATMLAGDVAPDVFMVHRTFLPTVVKHRLGMPLDDWVAQDEKVDLDDFFPRAVQMCRIDGELYMIPVSMSTVMLYYNKEHFDQAGLDYPDETWRWADLLSAAKALTVFGPEGRVQRFGLEGPNRWITYMFFIWQNGGRIFDESGHCVIGREEYIDANVEALEFIRDMQQVHQVIPSASQSEVLPANPFLAGKTSMTISGTWLNNQILSTTRAARQRGSEVIDWGIAPIPYQKQRATFLSASCPIIYAGSPSPEAAWRLIRYFAQTDWQKSLPADGRSIPGRKDVAYSDAYLKQEGIPADVDLSQCLDQIQYGRPIPGGPEAAELIDNDLRFLMEDIFSGRLEDIRSGLVALQEKVDSDCPYCSGRR